ncbi:protein of unknown function [Burkholderia multivorans]
MLRHARGRAETDTTGGHSGDVVRDVMLAAVEQRFGTTQATQPIEWLSDNGSAYIDHRTRSFARELGLEPLTTPVRSPQSNGMPAQRRVVVRPVIEQHDYSVRRPYAFIAMDFMADALANGGRVRMSTRHLEPGVTVSGNVRRRARAIL